MTRYRLQVLARPGQGLGFRLAGAAVEEVDEAHAADRVGALLADRTLGVLAIEEPLFDRLPEALLERVRREGVPVLLPYAAPERSRAGGAGESYVAAMIRRAIGYHIKIGGAA